MKEYPLTITSPAGTLFEGNAVRLLLRGTEGDFAILADHIPFVTCLRPGDCRIDLADGTDRTGYCESGILTVTNRRVLLLSSTFSWKNET